MQAPPFLVAAKLINGSVAIEWSDGVADSVTPTWLRDACHCVTCRGPSGGQRRFELASLSADQRVTMIEADGAGVAMVFSDGHHGTVPSAVVLRRRAPARSPRWGAEHGDQLRQDQGDYDGDLATFLIALDRHGVAMVGSVPAERDRVTAFGARIGFVRETNYGRAFDVVAEPDPANLANSTDALPVHTDNPYRDPVPTVQLLHCIEASGEGGATRLVDGFGAAERLARKSQRAFEILTAHEVGFRYVDNGVDLRARGRLIDVDAAGDIKGVRMNNRSMEPLDLPDADLDPFYAAYRAFAAELADPDATVDLKLRPGDLVAFDNRRVMHGRTGYSADSRRLLQGCYVDIDAVSSAVRVMDEAGT